MRYDRVEPQFNPCLTMDDCRGKAARGVWLRTTQARNPGSLATQNLTRGILSLRDPAERLGHPSRNPGSLATQNLTCGILSLRDLAGRLGHPVQASSADRQFRHISRRQWSSRQFPRARFLPANFGFGYNGSRATAALLLPLQPCIGVRNVSHRRMRETPTCSLNQDIRLT